MQVDYFSTVLDLGQHILLEIDPTDIEYQLRTIQIDHLPGCRLETFRVHTGRNEHFDPKVIADDFGNDPAQRKNRYEDRRPLVGGRDAQPLKSNHGIISENMAIFRNIDKYIYLQIY